MQMLCYKCGHSWSYKGKKNEEKDHITCPGCYYKILLGKALIEAPSEQKLLSDLPNKKGLPSGLLSELPTTISFIEVEKDIFVEKKIAKQFKEAQEEMGPSLFQEQEQEQESDIKILPPKFEIIRIIPRDPIKILEHQQEYGLRIAN